MTQRNMMPDHFLEKPLPSSPDAERAILGGIVLYPDSITQAIEKSLKPEDFYSPNNRRIFQAMLNLFERNETIDAILIGEELNKEGSLDSIGGVAVIANMTYGLPNFDDIYDYIKIVKGKSIARNLVKTCALISNEALAEEKDIFEIVGAGGETIFNLLETQEKKGFQSIGDLAKASIAHAQEQARNASADNPYTLLGLSTGFTDLNEKTSGIQEDEVIVVGGRPGMGKTTVCLNIADNVTDDDREAVIGVFSLEMGAKRLTDRFLCSRAKVDAQRYSKAFLTKDEWARMAQAASDFTAKNIHIEDTANQTVIGIQTQAQQLKAKKKRLDLLIIDHLGLVKGNGKNENRHLELSAIMKGFVNMKKILGCPIILIHQLSQGVERRNPPKPMMSDLRDSGSIGEDADSVWLLYREEYYKPSPDNAGVAELILSKNRNGPTGIVKLAFLKEFNRFENFFSN